MRLAWLVVASVFVAVGCAPEAPETEAKGSTDSLIVGGKNAAIINYDGMIQTENDEQGAWCGATLIAPDWAVSAAHCVIDELTMGGFQRVVLGRQSTNGSGGEIIDVLEVIRHEEYDEEINRNDIALLHLAKKSKHAPVRLATKAEWPKLSAAGTPVTVLGWGATKEGGDVSRSLRKVTVPIVSTSTCNQQYEGIIDDRQVCAGLPEGGKDSCQGDSGGPLFENVDGVNVQIGIVSFGTGCARASFSGVYTSVAAFRDWIEVNTKGAVPATLSQVSVDDEEDTSSATSTSSAEEPTTEEDDADTVDRSSDDEEDQADEAPASSKKKKKSTRAPNGSSAQVGGCEMGRGGDVGLPSRALLVLAAFGGLLLRRHQKRKREAKALEELEAAEENAIATPRRRPRKLKLGRGGVVKHARV